jgi:hypothetical protein
MSAQDAARAADYHRLARDIIGYLRPASPTVPALITSDLGTVNGTPVLRVDVGGGGRRAIYPLPYPAQVGRLIFVEPVAPGARELVAVASNYQVTPRSAAGGGAPILFGEPATNASPTPDSDWTEGDGAMLPMPIGEVPV